MDQPLEPGLYIVATPIGNLGDITPRAAGVLRAVSAVACEDTRVTAKLLNHLGIKQRMIRYDDHASEEARDHLLDLAAKAPLALVSDAGTPLISDPGYRLVREARELGIAVTSLPGANAAITALTLSGLPSDRFLFAGFLPSKAKAREDTLRDLAAIPATLVFYETGPRLVASLQALEKAMPDREVAVARELTKLFEEVRRGTLAELAAAYRDMPPPKGEIAIVVGPPAEEESSGADVDALLARALSVMSVRDAATSVAEASGRPKKEIYRRALQLAERKP